MKKTKERKMKNHKGITLIALVVTIVVLLILAGVSISMLGGENGIITQAQNAKISTEIANEKESIQMAIVIALDPNKTEITTVEEMQKAMDSVVGENTSTVLDNGETTVIKFEQSGRYYEVDDKGKISSFTLYEDTTPGELAMNDEGNFMIESIEDLVVFSAMQNGGYSDEYVSISSNSNIKVALMRDLDFKSSLSYNDCTTTIYNGYLGIEDKNTTLIEALTNTEKYKGFIPIADENHLFSRNI